MKCPQEMKKLMKVLYNLSNSETEVLYYLCNQEARVQEIADDLGKDRSTIQRYLSKLMSSGLVKRESHSTEEGKTGRYYVYSVPDKKKMKKNIEERMEEWKEEKFEVMEDI